MVVNVYGAVKSIDIMSSCAMAICNLTQGLSCVMRTTPYQFVFVIRVLGCTPEHVCASLHNTMPAVPSATPHKISKRCVHLSVHLLLLHALMPFIALLYQSMCCYAAGVLAVVHAVGIVFAAAKMQLLTQPLLPLNAGIAACAVAPRCSSLLMHVLSLYICCFICWCPSCICYCYRLCECCCKCCHRCCHYHVCRCPLQLLLLLLPLVLLSLHLGLPKLEHTFAWVSTHVSEVLLQVL